MIIKKYIWNIELCIGEWKNGKGNWMFRYVGVKHNYVCMDKDGYIKPNFKWTLDEDGDYCRRTNIMKPCMLLMNEMNISRGSKNIKLKIFKNKRLFDEN